MLPAFEVFDKERKGFLLAEEFRTVLPLLGEDVPEEEIDRLFIMADEDNSGSLEFDEFQILVRGMNPKTMSAVAVLDTTVQSSLNPQQLRKAGAVVQNMQEAGYSDEEVNTVCRALFLDRTEEVIVMSPTLVILMSPTLIPRRTRLIIIVISAA